MTLYVFNSLRKEEEDQKNMSKEEVDHKKKLIKRLSRVNSFLILANEKNFAKIISEKNLGSAS